MQSFTRLLIQHLISFSDSNYGNRTIFFTKTLSCVRFYYVVTTTESIQAGRNTKRMTMHY